MLSFLETDFTFGRSLIAVLGETSDGAIGEEVVCDDATLVMLAFGNKLLMFGTLVMLAVDGVTEMGIFFIFIKIEQNQMQLR